MRVAVLKRKEASDAALREGTDNQTTRHSSVSVLDFCSAMESVIDFADRTEEAVTE